MKVFLDTNVLVSGFATRGLCADVIRLVLAEHELISAEVVIEEVERILVQKIGLPDQAVQDILAFLESHTVQPKPKAAPSVKVRDPDDLWVWRRRLQTRPMSW